MQQWKGDLTAKAKAAGQAAGCLPSRGVEVCSKIRDHARAPSLVPGLQSLAAILSLCRVLSDRGGSDLRAQAGAPKQELSSALWLLLR